jgi:hypothetical protein
MENYRNLSPSELQFERIRIEGLQNLASMLTDDDPQKETYLRLYGLQLSSITAEEKKRARKNKPTLFQRLTNWLTKPATI